MQPKYMTKEELHKLVDELPEDKVMVITYNKDSGVSDNGRMTSKNKTRKYINQANIIILIDGKIIKRIDLEGNFHNFPSISRENIIKSILLPQLE